MEAKSLEFFFFNFVFEFIIVFQTQSLFSELTQRCAAVSMNEESETESLSPKLLLMCGVVLAWKIVFLVSDTDKYFRRRCFNHLKL